MKQFNAVKKLVGGFCAGAVLLFLPADASAQNYYNSSGGSYGGLTYSPDSGTFQYYSERDLRRQEKREQEAAESQQREADKRQRREDDRVRKQQQRDANKYVPKPAVDAPLEIHSSRAPRTLDRAMDAFGPSNNYVPPDVPPQRDSMLLIGVGDDFFYYGEGKFYAAEGDDMRKVAAPPGAIIFDPPPGAQVVATAQKNYYYAESAWYERVMITGTAGYKVVPRPDGLADPATEGSAQSGS